MVDFTRYRIENAPTDSKELLSSLQQELGFVPELFAYMAESPEMLNGYLHLARQFVLTSLSPIEQRILLLAISVENGCEYCVPAHSVIAKQLALACPKVVDAIRNHQPIPDERLNALVTFALNMKNARGRIDHDEVERFLDAGFTRQNVFEVIMALSLKTLTNYANTLIGADLDEEFAHEAWSNPRKANPNYR